jgi:hypothetical protein
MAPIGDLLDAKAQGHLIRSEMKRLDLQAVHERDLEAAARRIPEG